MARAIPKIRQSQGWVGGVFCGLALAIAPSYAVLFGGSLLPGFVVWLTLRERPRRTAQAMLLFGLAMSVDRAPQLWAGGGSLASAWDLLIDPIPLTMAWFAGAFGWALTELLPLAVSAALEFEARRQSAGLRRARRRAVDGWELGEGG